MQQYDLQGNVYDIQINTSHEKTAKEMFEELGYELDKEPRFGSIISYTKYCSMGCCRECDLCFFENGVDINETFITLDFIKAINQQCKELGWLDE